MTQCTTIQALSGVGRYFWVGPIPLPCAGTNRIRFEGYVLSRNSTPSELEVTLTIFRPKGKTIPRRVCPHRLLAGRRLSARADSGIFHGIMRKGRSPEVCGIMRKGPGEKEEPPGEKKEPSGEGSARGRRKSARGRRKGLWEKEGRSRDEPEQKGEGPPARAGLGMARRHPSRRHPRERPDGGPGPGLDRHPLEPLSARRPHRHRDEPRRPGKGARP